MKKEQQNSDNPKNPQLQQTAVKCRFFAQYWGVKCMKETKHSNSPLCNVSTVFIDDCEYWHLELKPLSKITDDDAIEYFDILWHETHKSKSKEFKIEYGKDWANSILTERFGLIPSNILHGIDFLRSKGYAIPFMGYSVEMLVNAGWVRLV